MAELALEESLWNQVCFHAHQATEKSLKALVTGRSEVTPRTHKLMDLLTLLEGGEPSLGGFADGLRSLESYYIPTRYPDILPSSPPEALPGREEAKEALATARKVSEAIRKVIERPG